MGTILVFETADFSASRIRKVDLSPYVWSNVTVSSWTAGFVNESGTTSNNSNWTPVWKYSNKITLPVGARKIKGFTNAIDVSFNSGQTYTWYPCILFYNSNSSTPNVPIKNYYRRNIYDITGTSETSAGNNRVLGSKGNIQVTVPTTADQVQFQFVYGSNTSQTGNLTNIIISAPTLQYGYEST